MSDAQNTPPKKTRERSPSFPFIPIRVAVDRLIAFEQYFRRHPTPTNKAGLAWDMRKTSSQADQTLAAMRSYGFIGYEGTRASRVAKLTDEGRKFIRTQQDSVKKQILRQCALRPKIIRKYWATWGADRPHDAVALDQLYDAGFSDVGAVKFLKIYDDTIAYAGLTDSDKIDIENEDQSDVEDEENDYAKDAVRNPPPPLKNRKGMELEMSERELTTGLLSKDSGFRLIVHGKIGPKEIERLIAKLRLDKEILADSEDDLDSSAKSDA